MKQSFTLTDHACERQIERSGLSPARFLQEACEHAVLVICVSTSSRYWLLWLKEERQAHVFVATAAGVVITVFPALRVNGVGGFMRDSKRTNGFARVKSHMLLEAIQAAGGAPEDAQELLGTLLAREERHRIPRAWDYAWVLRCIVTGEDGRPRSKVIRLGQVKEEQEQPPAEVLKKAHASLKEVQGWDAVLTLEDRDTREEVAAVELF